MRKTKKALASLAIAGMVLSMAPMAAFAATTQDSTTDRIAGADRIETAVKVAQTGWTTAATVIVAPAADANLVDALAAAPLAGQAQAPILLTDGAALDAKTKQEIVDLKATKVYAVGALSDQVVKDLQGISGVSVEALKGADRIETATKIVAKLTAPKGSFVVGYNALADALSVASFAAANNYEILVANPDGSLPSTEATTGTSYVIGGPTLVKDVTGATRIYGQDRFETNQKVLAALTYSYNKVYVANGNDEHLVDSLVASSLAAKDNAVIALSDGTNVLAAGDLNAKVGATSQVVALGGTTVVPDSVKGAVNYVAPGTLAATSVSVLSLNKIQVVFNQQVDQTTAENVANYKLGTTASAVTPFAGDDEATLQADGKTVVLELAGTSGSTAFLTKDTSYVLKLANVKNVAGSAYVDSKAAYSFLAKETVKPTVDSMTPASSTTFTVKMNEALGAVAPLVTVDGVVASASTPTAGDTSFTVTLPSGKTLSNGNSYNVYIAGAVDLYGNAMNPVSQTLTVNSDNTGVHATISVTDADTIRLVFDKPLDSATSPSGTIKVQKGTTTPATITLSSVAGTASSNQFRQRTDVDDTGKTWDLSIPYQLGGSTQAIMTGALNSDTVQIVFSGLKDALGNVAPDSISTVTLNKDTVAPTLSSAYVSDDKSRIVLKFSEKVNSSANIGSIQVKDSNGVYVSGITGIAVDGNDTTLVNIPAPTSFSGSAYTVYVPSNAVKDQNYLWASNLSNGYITRNQNDASSMAVNISAGMSVKPAVTITKGVSNNSFVVSYDQKMGTSAIDPANYVLNGSTLPSNTDISFANSDQKVVNIVLPSGFVTIGSSGSPATAALTAGSNIQSASGVAISSTTSLVSSVLVDNSAALLTAAAVSGNQITLTFDQNIGSVNASDFVVTVGDQNFTGTFNTPVISGEKQVTFTVNTAGNWDNTKVITVGTKSTVSGTTDTNGSTIKAGVVVTATK